MYCNDFQLIYIDCTLHYYWLWCNVHVMRLYFTEHQNIMVVFIKFFTRKARKCTGTKSSIKEISEIFVKCLIRNNNNNNHVTGIGREETHQITQIILQSFIIKVCLIIAYIIKPSRCWWIFLLVVFMSLGNHEIFVMFYQRAMDF